MEMDDAFNLVSGAHDDQRGDRRRRRELELG